MLDSIHEFPLTEDSLVWIVGGYSGVTAQYYADKYNCRIEVFEPQLPFVVSLREIFKGNPKVTVHPFGLRDRSGQAPMALEGSFGCTFTYPADWQEAVSIPYEFKDIGDYLNADVDLLFLNCEGGEWEILPRLIDSSLIRLVKFLMVQFHPSDELTRFIQLKAQIELTHRNITDQGHTWQSWGRNG